LVVFIELFQSSLKGFETCALFRLTSTEQSSSELVHWMGLLHPNLDDLIQDVMGRATYIMSAAGCTTWSIVNTGL
jgi:hypothetical protein